MSSLPGFRDITSNGFRGPNYNDSEAKRKNNVAYGDWASDIEIGDEWDYRPVNAELPRKQRDTRERYPNTRTPRDSFMRPIADPIGVIDRLSWDRVSREERLGAEATLNRRESRAALVFAGLWLFLIPFGLGYFFSRGIAEPVLYYTQVPRPQPSVSRSFTHTMGRQFRRSPTLLPPAWLHVARCAGEQSGAAGADGQDEAGGRGRAAHGGAAAAHGGQHRQGAAPHRRGGLCACPLHHAAAPCVRESEPPSRWSCLPIPLVVAGGDHGMPCLMLAVYHRPP